MEHGYTVYVGELLKIVKNEIYLNDALYDAAANDYFQVVKLLLADGRAKVIVDNRRSALSVTSDINIIKLFIDYGVDPEALDNEAIIQASETGNYDVVKFLLKYVDPSARDNEAIILAAERGESEVVELLMSDHRVNPSARHNEAIKNALYHNYGQSFRAVKSLLKDPELFEEDDWDSSFSFKQFIEYITYKNENDKNTIELLIKHPSVDPVIIFKEASRRGLYKIVELLMSHYYDKIFNEIPKAFKLSLKNGNAKTIAILLRDRLRKEGKNIKYPQKYDSRIGTVIVLNLFLKRGIKTSLWDASKLIEKYVNLSKSYTKHNKLLYEYWENKLGKPKLSHFSGNITDNGEIVIYLRKDETLSDFSYKYRLQIRGYLRVKSKEMVVIFQDKSHSNAYIVRII